ncbi:MAG: hypothetical protein Q7R39_13680 [Dehalococcoidia bacterium]|nr:hypothetical protein [Dehalococcoidia bacterium]
METEVLDVIRPLLIMGGAMVLVMLCRELRRGWLETVTVRRLRQQSQERHRPGQDDKDADQE